MGENERSRSAIPLTVLPVLALGLAGCYPSDGRIATKETLLTDAGFSEAAATPQQLAAMPKDHFLLTVQRDAVVYVYADPAVCDCVYTGDRKAYDRYNQELSERGIPRGRLDG